MLLYEMLAHYRFEHWTHNEISKRISALFREWMPSYYLAKCCANLISALPLPTPQTLSASLSHQFSDTFKNETAVGPPTLNSHYFSSCCPTALLQRRYRQSLPVGRRRRAKLTRSNRHIQAWGNVAWQQRRRAERRLGLTGVSSKQ